MSELTWVENVATVDAIDRDRVAMYLHDSNWRLLHAGVGSGGQTTLTFGWPWLPPTVEADPDTDVEEPVDDYWCACEPQPKSTDRCSDCGRPVAPF